MGGNQLLTGPDLNFIDVSLKDELLSGIGLGDGIGVSFKPYPAIGVGPHFHLAVTAKLFR